MPNLGHNDIRSHGGTLKIAIMGGSLRKDSLNLKLLDYLAKTIQSQGPHVRVLAGADLRLPL